MKMDPEAFGQSLKQSEPPSALRPVLKALWHEAKGDWNRAHNILQDENDGESAWVHAYLHRKEGDPSNAAYWYRRAGKPVFTASFEQEWDAIVTALLRQDDQPNSARDVNA